MKTFKAVILSFLAVIAAQYTFAQAGKVTISGVIINIKNKMQVSDASEIRPLGLPNDDRSFIPDAFGRFSVTFNLNEPGYFRIGRTLLYLRPGDNLNAMIDYNKPLASVYSGSGVDANNYLRGNLFPHAGSYLDAGSKIQPNIPRTIDTILAITKVRARELKKTQNLTPEFRKYEEARLKADVINSLVMIKTYFAYIHKIARDDLPALEKNCAAAISPYVKAYSKELTDADNLRLEVFAMRADDILDKNNTSPQAAKIADWLKAADVAYKIQHMGTKNEIVAMKPQVDAITTQAYKSAVTDTYNSLVKFGNGDKAIDFTALTADGKTVKMSDFAGKIIFVDIWATWCGPCLNEMPAMEKLKAKYKDNQNVVFISLSIDDDKLAWKKKLAGLGVDGLQVIADRASLNDYSVIDIPRTIVIDQDFKIVAMKGNLPSAPQTAKLLDGLLSGTK